MLQRSPMPRSRARGAGVTSEEMRIGFLEPHLEAFGGIRRVLETSNRLVARGHRVTIYLPDARPLRCDWMECRSQLKHVSAARQDELDFIVFNHEPQWYLLERFERAIQRVFLALHYSRTYEKNGSWESLRYPVDLLLANSAWTADRIEEEIGQRPAIVPTGVAQDVFRPMDVPKLYPVLCVGDQRPWKGTRTIDLACERLGLTAERYAHKNFTQQQLAEEYSKAEVFAVGSTNEGFGFPGLEALACGVPLVTTDNGGCREYAFDGETALVVPPGDADAMADAIGRLRADRGLRERLARNGLNLVKERFSWERAAAGLEKALADLAGRGRASARRATSRPLREPDRNPLISIIVLSYNTFDLLQRCVESIRQHTDVPYELVLVDTGSHDGSDEYIAAAADRPILNGYNAGFAGGFNQGLAAARGDFVFFLDSDTKVPPSWASSLVETLRDRPSAGIVYPAVTACANPLTVRAEPTDRVSLIEPFMEPPSAVALGMRTAVARELGGWSERYETASGEDVDLCFTVWVNGLETVLDERVLVTHVGKASARQLPDQKMLWAQNRRRFLDRWTGPLEDVNRLRECPEDRFEANKRVARGVAFWMRQFFDERDRDVLSRAHPFGSNVARPSRAFLGRALIMLSRTIRGLLPDEARTRYDRLTRAVGPSLLGAGRRPHRRPRSIAATPATGRRHEGRRRQVGAGPSDDTRPLKRGR